MTARLFDSEGIIYETRRLDRSPKAIERFKQMGFLAAPIVETDTRRWSGFRLEKIRSLANHLRTERAKGINVPLEPMKQVADEVEDE
jgi:glutaredoxin-like protein NrdH